MTLAEGPRLNPPDPVGLTGLGRAEPGSTGPEAAGFCQATVERWGRGETGVPLVDASMRELVLTGYLSNR